MINGVLKAAIAAWAMGSAATVLAHSWVDCTKYDPVNLVCLGYPRGYPGRNNPDTNTLYTYLFSGSPQSQPMCNPKQQAAENYTPMFPVATVQPGETVYTSWEQNGHLDNANPTKVDILYYPSPSKELADVSERNTAKVAGTMDFATSANCYDPINPNSVCFGSWTVPKDLVPGNTYHFVWFWYFNKNPAGEWYSTCFDLKVEAESHVVGSKPVSELLSLGAPSLGYALGMTDAIKSEIAQVTSLGMKGADSASYEAPVSSAAPVSPVAHASSAAPVAPVAPMSSAEPVSPAAPASSEAPVSMAPSSSAYDVVPATAKCIPRPTSV
ncbi:hypothetical protein IWW50_002865 [Coemansia erecta]|nr:hypothetical protein GGF43_000078 [Coemansia sp. RSA 2618]KAJ2825400.1 hypothetical protein IWW50_002865 [Coemansia erecta]